MRNVTKKNIITALLFILVSLTPITLLAQQVNTGVKENTNNLIITDITNQHSLQTSSVGALKNNSLQRSLIKKPHKLTKQQGKFSLQQNTPVKPLLYKTRKQRIQDQQANSQNRRESTTQSNESFHQSFTIFDAYTQLIEDIDGDGFYQTFSVTFDADVISHHFQNDAVVFADLYLSENGGPWIHYFSTENFIIYGESTDDEYEVYTTLNNGYIPANYDVLIDLYEDGYNDIVATFSANDSNDLFALPLESSDYDPDYNQYQSTSHGDGGSSSLHFLLFTLVILVTRKKVLQ
jgi:hypothetical protein